MLRFLRKCAVWPKRSWGSSCSQKRCPARVVGTRLAERTSADSRGSRPSASREPAATCAPALTFTYCSTSRGTCTGSRSEEHTSELQSRQYLVCRLLLEKK